MRKYRIKISSKFYITHKASIIHLMMKNRLDSKTDY